MIKNIKHNGRDYLTVSTALTVDNKGTTILTPVLIHVDVTKLSETDRLVIYNKVDKTFNHPLQLKIEQVKPVKKTWWNKYLGR